MFDYWVIKAEAGGDYGPLYIYITNNPLIDRPGTKFFASNVNFTAGILKHSG